MACAKTASTTVIVCVLFPRNAGVTVNVNGATPAGERGLIWRDGFVQNVTSGAVAQLGHTARAGNKENERGLRGQAESIATKRERVLANGSAHRSEQRDGHLCLTRERDACPCHF